MLQTGHPPPGVLKFLHANWREALLILADLSPELIRDTRLYWDEDTTPNFVGLVYHGFETPIVSVVTGKTFDPETLHAFFQQAPSECILALHAHSILVPQISRKPDDEDAWLWKEVTQTPLPDEPEAVAMDEKEYQEFCERMQLGFSNIKMWNFGHAYGVKTDNTYCSMSSLNFILPLQSYAHIGNVFTQPGYRGKGYARTCLNATINSLSASTGIRQVGLFTDSADVNLLAWYKSLGFYPSQETFLFYYHFRKASLLRD